MIFRETRTNNWPLTLSKDGLATSGSSLNFSYLSCAVCVKEALEVWQIITATAARASIGTTAATRALPRA